MLLVIRWVGGNTGSWIWKFQLLLPLTSSTVTVSGMQLVHHFKNPLDSDPHLDQPFYFKNKNNRCYIWWCCWTLSYFKLVSQNQSEDTAGETIDILIVMYPAGLVSAAHRVSTVTAAHEVFAEVVCQAALAPAISQVKWYLFDPCGEIFLPNIWPTLQQINEFLRRSQTSCHHIYL